MGLKFFNQKKIFLEGTEKKGGKSDEGIPGKGQKKSDGEDEEAELERAAKLVEKEDKSNYVAEVRDLAWFGLNPLPPVTQ